MQAVTVAATPPNKFEVKDVVFRGLVGLVVSNPLFNGLGVFAGFHAGTLQKAQRNFCPASRATERDFVVQRQ